MHRKLRYVSKRNKLVQLVVQVKYHVNVIYSLGGGHTHTHARKHTDLVDKSNFKKPGARRLAHVWLKKKLLKLLVERL